MLIKTEHGVKPRYTSTQICKDFAGNLFIAACYFDDENRYNGEARLFKVDPSGTVTVLGERPMSRAKGDAVGICQSGSDILIVMGGHIGDPDTDLELLQAFTGVAVAYPSGMQPGHGGAQGFTETQSEPGGSGVTPQDIEAIKNAVVGQLRQEFGGNIRQGIMDKSRDGASQALSQAGVLTTGNAAPTLYQPIKDRVYEVFSQNAAGFWPWLAAKVRGTSQPQESAAPAPAPASQTVAGPRPDTLDVNVSRAPFDNAHQLGMTGQTEEGAQ